MSKVYQPWRLWASWSIARKTILVVGIIQFVNVLDFMIVIPLGPDLAKDLSVPESQLGWIAGSYTFAAALSGVMGSIWLDRFARNTALFWCVLGLSLSTALCGMTKSMLQLLLTRCAAGFFGGPATSLSLAVVADNVNEAERGRALGKISGIFAIASVLGVPASLEFARLSTWRMPFFAVAAMGLCSTLLVRLLPSQAAPASNMQTSSSIVSLIGNPLILTANVTVALLVFSVFMVIPNLSPYILLNLNFPRRYLGSLYLVGGFVSYVAMQVAGARVDRKMTSYPTSIVGSLLTACVMLFGFVLDIGVPVVLLFSSFMLANALSNVSFNVLSSKIPRGDQRAGYMSLQSAIRHISISLAAFSSAALLQQGTDQKLKGMSTIATFSILCCAPVPWLIRYMEAHRKQSATLDHA